MSVPQSTIYIVDNVPLDNRYEHTLYFSSDSDQREYFRSKVVKTFTGYTYLRKNWSIKVEASIAEAHRWTYLFFQNPSHERKWYYYFINKVSYVNDSTVELDLELDVLQTYRFDWVMQECFVERETTQTDYVGQFTMDEGLDTGPFVSMVAKDVTDLDEMCVLVMTTMPIDGSSNYCNTYDGVFSGLSVYAVDYNLRNSLGIWLEDLNTEGKIDAVVGMWMYPKNMVKTSWDQLLNPVTGAGYDYLRIDGLPGVKDKLFEGYQPKNNKVYCYPYNFLYVTNNSGGSAVYRYERFPELATEDIIFEFAGAISPDAGVKMFPHGYSCDGENAGASTFEEGISLPSFPSCAWNSDVYKVWLAQNQNQHALVQEQAKVQAVAGLGATVGSAVMGNVAGALGGLGTAYHAYTTVQNLMAMKADMAIQPDQARGAFSGTVNVANDKHTFTIMYKCATKEFAKSIDGYFTKYGYRVNRTGVPYLKNRPRFTYVKTVGCTITGPIGTEDRIRIESIFDNGVTWWADTENPCDYSIDNKQIPGGDY